MINYHKILTGNSKYYDFGLLVLRFLPSYYMIVNHGWKKITNPEKWERYGTFLTKYFGDLLDFLNVPLGFMAAFSESVCSILIIIGIFTLPSAILLSFTMLVAAMHHITGTGSPESAWIFFSIYLSITFLGPGKYSLDHLFFLKQNSKLG